MVKEERKKSVKTQHYNKQEKFSVYMYSSLLVAVQEKELLILEIEFFLEHQYQRDEPGKKRQKRKQHDNSHVNKSNFSGQKFFISNLKISL